MFLETVEYKLKNRVYHKVEHAVRDFRRIVYNSKLFHKVCKLCNLLGSYQFSYADSKLNVRKGLNMICVA